VIFVEPEQRVRDEEIADLVAAVVENQRAPILVLAHPRIGVLVKIGAVEFGRGRARLSENAGHPIEDDADARLMAAIDEIAELVGISKAARRRVVARHLIAPRTVERMLRDGQQLEMRVAHFADVREQRVREFAVAEIAIAFLDLALPRAEMHFVDAHRRVRCHSLLCRASIHAASLQV
jgi:hypothetical protein